MQNCVFANAAIRIVHFPTHPRSVFRCSTWRDCLTALPPSRREIVKSNPMPFLKGELQGIRYTRKHRIRTKAQDKHEMLLDTHSPRETAPIGGGGTSPLDSPTRGSSSAESHWGGCHFVVAPISPEHSHEDKGSSKRVPRNK